MASFNGRPPNNGRKEHDPNAFLQYFAPPESVPEGRAILGRRFVDVVVPPPLFSPIVEERYWRGEEVETLLATRQRLELEAQQQAAMEQAAQLQGTELQVPQQQGAQGPQEPSPPPMSPLQVLLLPIGRAQPYATQCPLQGRHCVNNGPSQGPHNVLRSVPQGQLNVLQGHQNNVLPRGPMSLQCLPQGQENVSPQGQENVDPQDQENVDPQGQENADPQGQENVNPQGQQNANQGQNNGDQGAGNGACQTDPQSDQYTAFGCHGWW